MRLLALFLVVGPIFESLASNIGVLCFGRIVSGGWRRSSYRRGAHLHLRDSTSQREGSIWRFDTDINQHGHLDHAVAWLLLEQG